MKKILIVLVVVIGSVVADLDCVVLFERLQERFNDRTPMAVRTAALTAENVTQYPIKENKRIQKYYANLKSKQEQYLIA